MPGLVAPLSTGIASCASGTAEFYIAGTTTPLLAYTIDPTIGDYVAMGTIAPLDSEGSVEAYVKDQADVVVRDSDGVEKRRFRVVSRSESLLAESPSFTGLLNGTQLPNGQVDLATILDRWRTSAGTTDWKIRRQALDAIQGSNNPFFDVTAYGAAGDGTTDDYAAITAAIAAAVASGGGIVFFPPGTYLHTTAIAVTSPLVSFLGVSPGTSIIKTSLASGFSFVVNPGVSTVTGQYIRDLGFTAAANTGGLQVVASPRFMIDNVSIVNMGLNTGATPVCIDLQTRVNIRNLSIDNSTGSATPGFVWFNTGSDGTVVDGFTGVTPAAMASPPFRGVAPDIKINNWAMSGAGLSAGIGALGIINLTVNTATRYTITNGKAATSGCPMIYTDQAAISFVESNNHMTGAATTFGYVRTTVNPTGNYRVLSRTGRHAVATSNSYSPDMDYEMHEITITAAVTIGAPASGSIFTPFPGSASRLIFTIYNSTAGNLNVTWNAIYSSNVTTVNAGLRCKIEFVYDSLTSNWRQMGMSNF
jgi:Pectate lyase superfamily protein